MNTRIRVISAFAALALAAASGAEAANVEKERAEVRKMCQEALATLYKAKPAVQEEVTKAAGYGCFSSFGVTLILGGAGGKGLVHDSATNQDTFMNMGQASAGAEISIKNYREVLVFKDKPTLDKFVTSGWEFSGAGAATATVRNEGASAEQTEVAKPGIAVYPLTKTGLALGVSAGGRKYWRSKDLN